jgi:azurin
LTREIRVYKVSRDFTDKLRRKGGRKEKIAGWVFVVGQANEMTGL